ncbi:hypothetical protein C5B96_14605 [Subtercola sp. Z020]|uniref:anti-sigma factor family protein n=1 Tax=Subtercola sp. Z020 TaxID=2080582 RepID=UPI000CE84014|nr:zf-HC2 domain-containing protein [Subtercola sp. Z020]PPF78624.1 hypothetical protein C5B96_14605 [Subtercola sp. Z020]
MSDDRYREWDAAYVLGSLSSAERHEYEQHLAGCADCTRALADLAGMPALLASVSPVEAFSLLDDAAPDAGTAQMGDGTRATDRRTERPSGQPADRPAERPAFADLARRVRRTRTRTRLLAASAAALAVAAAVAIALIVSLPPAQPGTSAQPQAAAPATAPATAPAPASVAEVAFTAEVASPLEADAKLADEPWGTRIDWTCSYRGEAGSAEALGYSMLVTDRQGRSTEVASWMSGPGTTATPTATTSIRRADIASVSIVATESGTVLLRSVLSPAG